jgi:hypothetical protein
MLEKIIDTKDILFIQKVDMGPCCRHLLMSRQQGGETYIAQ